MERQKPHPELPARFRFHVEISHPLAGSIVRYRGWLEPAGLQCSGETLSALAG
ncbi:DUF4166 domain-containing protein [Mesorhizobium sp. ORM6]